MKPIRYLALIAGLVPASCQPAHAEPICAPYGRFKADLAEKFDEHPLGSAVVDAESIIEIFVSPNGETFSILAIGVTGMACLLTSGEGLDVGELPNEGPHA